MEACINVLAYIYKLKPVKDEEQIRVLAKNSKYSETPLK